VLCGLVGRAAREQKDPENNSGEPEAPRCSDASVHALPALAYLPFVRNMSRRFLAQQSSVFSVQTGRSLP
jgi:hypothetical protein